LETFCLCPLLIFLPECKPSFFLIHTGLELREYTLSHSTSPFGVRYFQDRVLRSICPVWLQL
jgi:hypothetical protein